MRALYSIRCIQDSEVQPEARISRAIRHLVKSRGGFAFKVWGSEFMMAGLPDLICCYRGIFVAFETKTPEGRGPTRRQAYVHRCIRRAGGVVDVPRSVADASNVLDRIDAWRAFDRHVTDELKASLPLQME